MKKAKLKIAVEAHIAQMKDCVKGQGIDRHMFGLGILSLENGLPMPEIFTDPSFTKR